MKNKSTSYSRMAQILHWSSALLILAMWPMGFAMTRMGETINQTRLYRIHVAIGWVVLFLTVARVIWHFIDKYPDPPEELNRANANTFRWVHNLLYVAIFLLASSGISMLWFSGIGVSPLNVIPSAIGDIPPRVAHGFLSKIFLVLFLAHFGGVVRHQITNGNVFARMDIRGGDK